MDSETLQPIIDFIMQQGIWCALFIWFFITYKKEVSQREEKLYNLSPEEENDKFLKELKSFRHDL